jgi:hypothetical protein
MASSSIGPPIAIFEVLLEFIGERTFSETALASMKLLQL